MTIQPVRLFGDPVLRTRVDEVVDVDREPGRVVTRPVGTTRDRFGASAPAGVR